nr:EAL domain-containing protein [Pseudodesulfovibrio sp.]
MVENICPPVDEEGVRTILESKRVNTNFQPVVAIASKSIIGFEAFSRVTGDDRSIDTRMLFHKDLSPELMVGVDRMCRRMALEKFKPIHDAHKKLLLGLNVNVEIFPHIDPNNLTLPRLIKEAGINPGNIVLEVMDFAPDRDLVAYYCELVQGLGCKFCLDGCAVDDSFNYAITKINPDFIKLDRSFFGEAEQTDYSAKALDALLSVAGHVGASVIGRGVESESESIRLLLAGVDLQQGYYYTRSEESRPGDPAGKFMEKIVETHDKYFKVKNKLVLHKKQRFVEAFKDVSAICTKLSNMSEEWFEDGCKRLVRKVEEVISIFVLDDRGRQITRRISAGTVQPPHHPDAIMETGTDHSVEDYVLYLDIGYEKFVTPPFVSPFTGKRSCLISRPFFNVQGSRYMVCVELPHPG